jgi:pentose-5-phosphate-3-epimerase
MPIRPFLSGQAFDPETIAKMAEALQSVCDTLSLKVVDDGATRLVARKIIELTQRGVRDAGALRAMTLKEFKYE